MTDKQPTIRCRQEKPGGDYRAVYTSDGYQMSAVGESEKDALSNLYRSIQSRVSDAQILHRKAMEAQDYFVAKVKAAQVKKKGPPPGFGGVIE